MSEEFARPRQHYLDSLKVLLVVLVILVHAGQPYGPGGPWWIAPEKMPLINLLILGIFFAINMAFFMGSFFLISSYFVGSSFERKGSVKYIKDRMIKFGIPILIFVLLVFPVMDYLLFSHSTSFSDSYFSNYLGIGSNQSQIGLGHLWFLFLLLLFSSVYVAWRVLFKRSSLPEIAFPSAKVIIGFIVSMAMLEFIVRIWSPVNSWLPFGLFEPAHFPQYVLMFFAGLMAYRNDWLSKIPKGATVKWLSIAAWSFAAFGVMYAFWGEAMFKGGLTFPSLGMAAWESIMCVGMSIGLLSLFKTRFNSTSSIQKTLSNDAFTAYLVHVPIIVGLQLLLVDVAVPSLAKFAVVSLVGIPVTFFLSDLIKRLPNAKKIL